VKESVQATPAFPKALIYFVHGRLLVRMLGVAGKLAWGNRCGNTAS